MPTASAPAASSASKASTTPVPNVVLPSARNVIEARIGMAGESSRAARIPSRISSVEENVSKRRRSTASSRRIRTCSAKSSRTIAFVSGPYGFTSSPRGPTSPATKTYSPAAASCASLTAARLIFSRESAQSNFASLARLASHVFVVRIRAPAST